VNKPGSERQRLHVVSHMLNKDPIQMQALPYIHIYTRHVSKSGTIRGD
jgi:hypothetical protein